MLLDVIIYSVYQLFLDSGIIYVYNGEQGKSADDSYGGAVRKYPSPLLERGIFVMDTSAKPFITIDEQVQLLKDRKLVIDDDENVKRLLLSNNYYKIINGYSKFFPIENDTYTNETSFTEVIRLYEFDKELKEAFFKATLATESHLKAIFAYHFAEAYPDVRYSYLDIACYDPALVLNAVKTIHRLSGIIDKQKDFTNSSIHHYVRAYHNVPIWVLVNYIDFGDLRYMIMNSRKPIQNNVARDIMQFSKQNLPNLKKFPPENMLNLLSNINELRNICAHNNRLLGFKCRSDCRFWPQLHNLYNISKNSERRDVYSIYISLQCFLSSTEFSFLHNTLRKRMNYLSNQLHSIDINTVLKTIGFPKNWNTIVPKKKQ